MTEDEARQWLVDRCGVSRETMDKLERFAAAVVDENDRQNLISAGTVPQIWARHIVDSAQLLPLAEGRAGPWLDLGTGPGFPGLVIGILSSQPVILVESRRRRYEFLSAQATALDLPNVRVHGGQLDSMLTTPVSVISARAFAPLPRLFGLAHRFSTEETLWLLPKGRSAREELESAQNAWQGAFHVKPSLTDAEAAIIAGTGVRPRKRAAR